LLEVDDLLELSGGVGSVLSDLEHLLVRVVLREGLEVDGVGPLVEWDGTEDVHLVVFVEVEEDGLFVIL